jgi:long-chain acyl-CoA synthetase
MRGMAVAHHAATDPDRVALIAPSGRRTYGELNAHANQLARALRTRGLEAGDGVVLVCANRPEFAEVLAATQRAGLRLTPVNWHLTGGEAGYIVADCDAKALIAEGRFGGVASEAASEARLRARFAIGDAIDGFEAFDDVLTSEPADDLDDPVNGSTMIYTSGTTGRPKGVFRQEPPTIALAALPPYFYLPGSSVNICTGPLYHLGPLSVSLSLPLLAGIAVVLMDHWDPEEFLRLVEEHRVTHTHMVPTMFHQLLSLPAETRERYDVSSLLGVIHGAAPCPVSVKQRIIDWWGPVLYEYYAATEGAGTLVDSNTWLERPGTVGRPNPDDQVIVGDEEGRRRPPGDIGLVWLKAPSRGRFAYYKDDEKTASSYRGDYFTLGDMGYMDPDGFLFLTDRSANLVISGGVNIYPAEVDAVLLEHPAVADVATIGVPNAEWGEDVLAVVEARPEAAAGPELAADLIAFCRDRLAHYKCPKQVEFVEHLPRDDNGKIYKRLLRDQYRSRGASS